METLTEPRPLVDSRRYSQERADVLGRLDPGSIDAPIVGLISAFNTLPCCFTLQSCCGHFVTAPGQDDQSLEPVPAQDCGPVRYRIAYVALCLENSAAGKVLYRRLEQTAARDPDYVQFGSAEWFWERYLNSYALQVEPARYMSMDEAILDHAEALRVQERRDLFFEDLADLLEGFSSGHRRD